VQKISPTFFQIISTDYLAQNFFVMIFAGWVIYGIDALFEGHFTAPSPSSLPSSPPLDWQHFIGDTISSSPLL
jgi:hypothetical protein